MRLENILALTNGQLINSPFVSQFNAIVFEAKAVKRGDLFIAFDDSTIEEAVFNGAYGIIFQKPTQISDTEIAWIKVNDLDNALERILRFLLINKEITVYQCNEIVLQLALQVVTEPHFLVLEGDIKTIFKQLSCVEDKSYILFSPALVNGDIFTEIKELPSNAHEKIDIVEQTLFETSFIYDNVFYERQQLSPFFIPYLEELLFLFKTIGVNFRLRKFTPIEHFEAVFTNKNFEIKEFGTSDKVLIFEKNTHYIEKEIRFLQKHASWAKILFLIPFSYVQTLPAELQTLENLQSYKNEKEIKTLLKEQSFHFALIVGVDKSILQKPLVTKIQATLFDF